MCVLVPGVQCCCVRVCTPVFCSLTVVRPAREREENKRIVCRDQGRDRDNCNSRGVGGSVSQRIVTAGQTLCLRRRHTTQVLYHSVTRSTASACCHSLLFSPEGGAGGLAQNGPGVDVNDLVLNSNIEGLREKLLLMSHCGCQSERNI